MPTLYTASKVHNEIIFCVVYDQNKKTVIEKAFLKNRISYYETWEKVSFLMRLFGKKEGCQICINDMQREKAEEIIRELDLGDSVEMICKPIDKTYF
ncbi:MAG: hypothetical protein ACI4F8_00455 [Lachnospiraceae bacterium]